MGVFSNFNLDRAPRRHVNKSSVTDKAKQVLYLATGISRGLSRDVLRDGFHEIFNVTQDPSGVQIFNKRMRAAEEVAEWLEENDVKLITVAKNR